MNAWEDSTCTSYTTALPVSYCNKGMWGSVSHKIFCWTDLENQLNSSFCAIGSNREASWLYMWLPTECVLCFHLQLWTPLSRNLLSTSSAMLSTMDLPSTYQVEFSGCNINVIFSSWGNHFGNIFNIIILSHNAWCYLSDIHTFEQWSMWTLVFWIHLFYTVTCIHLHTTPPHHTPHTTPPHTPSPSPFLFLSSSNWGDNCVHLPRAFSALPAAGQWSPMGRPQLHH